MTDTKNERERERTRDRAWDEARAVIPTTTPTDPAAATRAALAELRGACAIRIGLPAATDTIAALERALGVR